MKIIIIITYRHKKRKKKKKFEVKSDSHWIRKIKIYFDGKKKGYVSITTHALRVAGVEGRAPNSDEKPQEELGAECTWSVGGLWEGVALGLILSDNSPGNGKKEERWNKSERWDPQLRV